MALVREIVTSNGATVRLMDDCCADVSAEEMRRRKQEMRRVLDRIARNAALRAAESGEGTNDRHDTEDEKRGI